MKKKLIIKNTIFMYISSLVTIVIGLYTSRVILNNLGFIDFGIYSVLYGLIAFLNIINASMIGSTQRYLAVAIGKKDVAIIDAIQII